MKSGGGLVVNAVCSLSSCLGPCLKHIQREGSAGSGATGEGGSRKGGMDGWTVGRKRKDTWKARLGQNAYDNQTEVLREGKERRGRHGEKERRKETRRKGECRE